MSKHSQTNTIENEQIVALLCVSDVAGVDNEVPVALAPLYGRPFLHHLIKSLEGLGIRRFFVGIDAVPGALLSYGDLAKREGLDIRFVRNPSDLAAEISDNVRVVVQSADTIWEQSLVDQALALHQPLIATVQEQNENQRFERIDLNNRWGGLAILNRNSVTALTSLPEGWDMGSALLRQALQDGVKQWPVAQKNVEAGLVRKLGDADELRTAMASFAAPDEDQPKSLERSIFSLIVKRVLPAVWATQWSRPLVEWLFPGLAALTALFAGFSFPLVGGVLAILAILSALVRSQTHVLEYRSTEADWPAKAGWALLALALWAALYQAELFRMDSGFVCVAMVGIAIFARNYWKASDFWLSSPVTIALVALLGHAVGMVGWAVRVLILAELLSLIVAQLKSDHHMSQTEDQA
jgi:hypothetical protein